MEGRFRWGLSLRFSFSLVRLMGVRLGGAWVRRHTQRVRRCVYSQGEVHAGGRSSQVSPILGATFSANLVVSILKICDLPTAWLGLARTSTSLGSRIWGVVKW